MNLPPHKCGLYLEHNAYKDIYQTVEQAVRELDENYEEAWLPGEREKALQTGEIWTLQWYPDTPIGFWFKIAASLEALLE